MLARAAARNCGGTPCQPTTVAEMAEERRNRQARLTIPASDAWDRLCNQHHVSLTTILEELGMLLGEGNDWVPPEAIRRAQRLDRKRGSRRR